jgi:hypothetical protein
MRNALVVALVCASALCACSKKTEEQGLTNWQKAPPLLAGVDEGANGEPGVPAAAASGSEAAPVAAGASGTGGAAANGGANTGAARTPPPPAAAGTVPVRKAGLWQTTMDQGRGPQSGTLCVSAESELRRGVFGGGRGPGCEPKIAKAGAGWTSKVSCTREFGDNVIKMSSSETLTGDLNVRYSIKGTSTTSGSGREEMNGARNITGSGVFKGPCPAGAKPGDFTGADGNKRNIFDAPQGGRGPGGAGGRRGGE